MRRRLVVLGLILALSVSVATRVFHGLDSEPGVQAYASHAMRQHLAADAVQIEKPVLSLTAMLLPVVAPHEPSAEPGIYSAEFAESLYDRPPPSNFLL